MLFRPPAPWRPLARLVELPCVGLLNCPLDDEEEADDEAEDEEELNGEPSAKPLP